jgi:DNA-binding GntR family transcriptional regulator
MAEAIVRSTLTDSVTARLRQEIRSGQIEAGSRLRQEDVARTLSVSTTPVREAFRALEREGLLVSYPHRGVIVFKPTIDDLVETYDIRIPLEATALELAVPNMTVADLQRLGTLLERMRAAEDDKSTYSALNTQYHQALYLPSHRPRLGKLITDLRDQSTGYLRFYAAIMPSAAELNREHAEIFEACRAGAAATAGDAVRRHLRNTVDHVSDALRAQGQSGVNAGS